MIGLIAVVLVFVLAGLTVVALAMRTPRRSGGSVRAGGPGDRRRGRSRRLGFIGAGVVALAFGVGIPALVLTFNADSQSKAAPGGVELTASQQKGREIYARNCAQCHTLASANSVGKVGPNLDRIIPVIADKKARIAFIDDAVVNGRARGQGQMPKGIIDGTDQRQVSDFIATTAGR